MTSNGLRGADVAVIVKRIARAAGLDPAEFSGHSLRSGMITSAAEAGASVFKIQEVSRHKSVDVLSGYVRRADLFFEHCGASYLRPGFQKANGSYPRLKRECRVLYGIPLRSAASQTGIDPHQGVFMMRRSRRLRFCRFRVVHWQLSGV